MRILIVGSGMAGLVAALAADRAGHEVTIATKGALSDGNTRHAQGGIAAALAAGDSVAKHVSDTIAAGAGLSVDAAVRVLCSDGRDRVRELMALGVPFDRDGDGPAFGLEAAHSEARVLHAGGDATGAAIESALVRAVRATGASILEHSALVDLLVEDGRVVGVLLDGPGGEQQLSADGVLLATGGAGRLFRHTTNPAIATADGVAAALRAGAEIADPEFYQFHPTALAVGGDFLISEAVRGDGAVLRNRSGARFMTSVHPAAELAPRDIVARGIAAEMAAQGGLPVLLDATALGAEFLARRFPTIDAATRDAGLDWSREPIPVTPAAHYWMGGVATDLWGRTSLPGLAAAGEVACTGVHGANRLASNSLLEAAVFGHRAVGALDGSAPAGGPWHGVEADARPATRLDGDAAPSLSPDGAGFSRAALQELMWDSVGLTRTGPQLRVAAARLDEWSAAEREDANLLEVARLVTRAALDRQESRGAHYRADHPEPSAHAVHSRFVAAPIPQGALAC